MCQFYGHNRLKPAGEGLEKQHLSVNRERSWLRHVDEQSTMPINLLIHLIHLNRSLILDPWSGDPWSLIRWSLIRWSSDTWSSVSSQLDHTKKSLILSFSETTWNSTYWSPRVSHVLFHSTEEQRLGKNNFHFRWQRILSFDDVICSSKTLTSTKTGCTHINTTIRLYWVISQRFKVNSVVFRDHCSKSIS